MRLKTSQIARAAVIAALYAAICFFLKPISYGSVQLRLSEVLCVLPIFVPESIAGLFIGCIIANLLGGASVALIDAVLGSLTTLFAAFLTRRIYQKTKNMFFALLPPVILNALIVGTYIPFVYTTPSESSVYVLLFYSILTVFIGQALVIYLLGLPFAKALSKTKLFKY